MCYNYLRSWFGLKVLSPTIKKQNPLQVHASFFLYHIRTVTFEDFDYTTLRCPSSWAIICVIQKHESSPPFLSQETYLVIAKVCIHRHVSCLLWVETFVTYFLFLLRRRLTPQVRLCIIPKIHFKWSNLKLRCYGNDSVIQHMEWNVFIMNQLQSNFREYDNF